MRVASLTLRAASLQPLGRAQAQLAAAQAEMATGRLADPGRTLGARSTARAALEGALADTRATREALGVERARLQAAGEALTGMAGVADALVAGLVTAISAPTDTVLRLTADDAAGLRSSAVAHANVRLGSTHLFGGTRTDAPPLADPRTNAAARDWVREAFVGRFGHPPEDAATRLVDAASLRAFVGEAEADFAATGFSAAWAGDPPGTRSVRLGPDEAMDVPVTHHDPALRDLVLASSLAAELGAAPLAGEARDALLEGALGIAGRAQSGLAEAAGRVGLAQERAARAGGTLSTRLLVTEAALGDLIGVEGIDAAARVSALVTSIETSLAVTARIERLSLVNHL